jgi:hypothetical protein
MCKCGAISKRHCNPSAMWCGVGYKLPPILPDESRCVIFSVALGLANKRMVEDYTMTLARKIVDLLTIIITLSAVFIGLSALVLCR